MKDSNLKGKIKKQLTEILDGNEVDNNLKSKLAEQISAVINDSVSQENLRNNLDILFEYEKHYLNLIKEFKEEIKFATNLQEDLRKERSKFFAETLKEVSDTLRSAEVDSKVASKWIEELVSSYTKSLDLSGDLATENTIDIIGSIREQSKKEVSKSELKKENEK